MSDYWVNQLFTPTEAKAFLKKHRRGKSFFISCGQFAPIPDTDRGFHVMANVPASLKTVFKFLSDAYSNKLVELGARVRITGLGQCLFVGSAA